MGGSGFRSAPSQTRRYAAPPSRSYSSPPSRSYSPPPPTRGYVERVPMAVPVVPYSPFGGFGFGVSPFYVSWGVLGGWMGGGGGGVDGWMCVLPPPRKQNTRPHMIIQPTTNIT